MNMASIDDKVPRIVRNEAFYAFARVCMVTSLPLMAFIGHRIISAADEIRDQVAKQNLALQLLAVEVKYRVGSVEDHEQRLRKLEFVRHPPL